MKKLIWLACLVGLSACQTAENTVESMATLSSAQATQALFGTWQLRHYADGKKINYAITLEISAEKNEQGHHQLSGKAPVNFYFAQAQLQEAQQSIRLQGVGSTKMAGPPEAMEQEMRYFQRLADIRQYAVSSDQNTLVLTISTPQTEKLTFTRVSR